MPRVQQREGRGERGGTCAGSEQYGAERERQSRVKPQPLLTALKPPWDQPTPTLSTTPAVVLKGGWGAGMRAVGTGALGHTGQGESSPERSRNSLKSLHSKSPPSLALGSLLGAHSRSHWALAEGHGLGATGRPPSPLNRTVWSGRLPAKGSGGRSPGWGGDWPVLGREDHGRRSGPTHFWSTKMPTMRVKEIRSAVTHMRQYSSGGCGQTARGQLPVMVGPDQGSRPRGPWAGGPCVTLREGQRRTWRGLGVLR